MSPAHQIARAPRFPRLILFTLLSLLFLTTFSPAASFAQAGCDSWKVQSEQGAWGLQGMFYCTPTACGSYPGYWSELDSTGTVKTEYWADTGFTTDRPHWGCGGGPSYGVLADGQRCLEVRLLGTCSAGEGYTNYDAACITGKRVSVSQCQNVCDLKANISGPGNNLTLGAGGSFTVTGSYTTSSPAPTNWTIVLPNGKQLSGAGSDNVTATWDGTLADGSLATPGTYQATFTVTSATDSTCNATATLPIRVVPPPNQCGLDLASFGSSAHLANGNLSYTQELFSTRGGAMPVRMEFFYNSRDPHNGALGLGWSHNFDMTLKVNPDGSVLVTEANWKYDYFTSSGGSYSSQPGYYSTLGKNGAGNFALTTKDGQVYSFNSDGTLASIGDRNGNMTALGYTGGNLASVTDPAGRVAALSYDGNNHLVSVTDPAGNGYGFSYSGNALVAVTYPDGGTWHFTYAPIGYMLSKIDPLGNAITYGYDASLRVTNSTDPEGNVTGVSYPIPGANAIQTTTVAEKDGGVWNYSYDTTAGTLTIKTDPQGGVTIHTYDGNGNRTSTTLPNGSTSSYVYDARGNMISETDPLGQTTGYSYNGFGQILTERDPQGNVTTYNYDPNGNLTAISDPTGATTRYSYDAKGNMTAVTNAIGQVTSYGYDTTGNLASITDPASGTTSFVYDSAGNIVSQADAGGNTTSFVYDVRNRLQETADPLGNVTSYAYDPSGNRISQTDANGNVTKYGYNFKGQVVTTTDALGNVTTYAYGTAGCASCGSGTSKITSITAANGHSTNYHYDTLGRLVSETDPLGNGNMASRTDANGATTTFVYDSLGRLLKKSYPDGTATTFSYDGKGNILTASNSTISYAFTYDARGGITSVSDSNGKTISYSYDAAGNKTKTVSPDGRTITNGYDTAGRLSAIVDGGTFTFVYDNLGRRSRLFYPNGDITKYAYDPGGRLTNVLHRTAGGVVLASNSYGLDKVGNRLGNASPDRTISYRYDAIYRLIQATTSTPGNSSNTSGKGGGISTAVQQQREAYTYDPVGNRLSSATVGRYFYNEANELLGNGGSYSYDKNGNLIRKTSSDGTTLYAWDYENRLSRVTVPDGTVAAFAYDPFGRRILKTVAGQGTTSATGYFYDGQNILFDYDDTGAIGNRYTHGPGIDEHLKVVFGKNSYYYHADGLGTVVALDDSAGHVVQSYQYDSFGNVLNRVKQPFAFTGREWDKETGLYYYRARYYDPMEGRFISKDPIGYDGGDTNLYAYVGNNVVNLVDPTGLSGLKPGGPYHPPEDVAFSCKGTDSCLVIMAKIWILEKMLYSHIGWDLIMPSPRGGDRHAEEIANLFRALAKCERFKKNNCDCDQGPPPKPPKPPVLGAPPPWAPILFGL